MTVKHSNDEGSTRGVPQVRGVTLDWDTHCEVKKIAEVTGMKMSDLYRLAISRLIEEVRETGRLPLPMVQMGRDTEGGQA